MNDLKEKLIELGNKHPDLRDNLRVILDHVTGKSSANGDMSDQKKDLKMPTAPKEDGKIFSTSPAANNAFQKVLLPQIETNADAWTFEDLTKMMSEIEQLGKSHNIELEDALIVYKPISMDTRRFYLEIQDVFKNWMRPKLKGQGVESEPNTSEESKAKKEYNFNFS